jgi:hypothetical protein
MISRNKKLAFGGKVADIETQSFTCVLTTAKEGIFTGLSTVIHEVLPEGGARACTKLIYNSHSKAKERRDYHDILAIGLDESGETGISLSTALKQAIEAFNQRGILESFIDLS